MVPVPAAGCAHSRWARSAAGGYVFPLEKRRDQTVRGRPAIQANSAELHFQHTESVLRRGDDACQQQTGRLSEEPQHYDKHHRPLLPIDIRGRPHTDHVLRSKPVASRNEDVALGASLRSPPLAVVAAPAL